MRLWVFLSTAIALAMDAFAVAVAAGIQLRHVSFRQTFRLAWHFGLFQALMPIAGWALGAGAHSLVKKSDHWIAFVLLAAVGGKMIVEAAHHTEGRKGPADPTTGSSLMILSVATSIDALAVGFGLSVLGISIWWPALLIGFTAAAFTTAGMHLGRLLSGNSHIDRYAEVFGGLVLVAIGFVILHEHGMF